MKNNFFYMFALVVTICFLMLTPVTGANFLLGKAQAVDGQNYREIFTVDFSKNDLIIQSYAGYDIIKLDESTWLNEPGNPFLPQKMIQIAVPSDITVTDVTVRNIKQEQLPGQYYIFPAQHPLETDGSLPDAFINPNYEVYSSNHLFPEEYITIDHQSDLAGQPIVTLSINPVHYIPKQKSIYFTTSIMFEVEGKTGYICGDYLSPWKDELEQQQITDELQRLVINPEDVVLTEDPQGTPMTLDLPSGGPYDYVIIGASYHESYWDDLIEWRTKIGMKATYVTTSYIYNEYSGSDNQQKIRNFVIDATNNWGTDYFLIVGENNHVPFEYRYYQSDSIPSDEYYADYDDDWTMEVFVGRVTAASSTEANRFIDKLIHYETNPPLSNYILDCTLLGMDLTLASDPPYYDLTRGEDLKEYIDTYYVPSRFTITEVYDTDGGNHETAFINALNDGQNLVNHNDHSYTTSMGCGDRNHGWHIDNWDVDALTNTNKLSNIYSLGCHPNEMDYNDCIAEHFVIYNSMQGAVSFTGNTRSGWFYVGDPINGLSSELDRDWWRGIFNYNHYRLGNALYYTKLVNDHGSDVEKYCQWTLNLLGDPFMPLWLDDPTTITASHSTEAPIGSSQFTVDTNAPSSTICLWKEGEVFEVGTADGSGDYTFNIDPISAGIMYITVTKQDHLPYEGQATISEINHPPYEPTPINPDDGETEVNIDTVLVWTGGDEDPSDTVEYDVYFGTSPSPPYYETTPTYQSWDNQIFYYLPTLPYETTHYWKIIARDNHGEETTSDIWSFTTEGPPTYTLTISIDGQGDVIKDPDQPEYQFGEEVTVTAIEDPGWEFDQWSGDLQGSTNPDSLIMDEDKTITAHFNQLEYTITTTVDGYGQILLNPDQPTYHYGDSVQVTAEAADGWYFNEWSDDLSGTINPTYLTVTGDMSVTATFLPGGYILDLVDFPMYQAEAPYQENCGPAVAQMTLNYIWWNQTQEPTPPLLYDNQQYLYDQGLENNTDQTIPYLDTQGLWALLQGEKPGPYSEWGYNFLKKHSTDQDTILKQICAWIDYPIGTYGGFQEGHPEHVPSLVPAYGDYSNWMAIRGIHTDQHAYPIPAELTVYGFWVNDPLPGGIGENSYKTIDTWMSDYYQPLISNDIYDGEYIAICEPPETTDLQELNYGTSQTRFTVLQQTILNYIQKQNPSLSPRTKEHVDEWIIQAAIQGLTDQLLDHDEELTKVFETTTPATPLFVDSTLGTDYYLIPFYQEKIDNTVIVVRINAFNGQFQEASWVQDPVEYLPVSQEEAQQLVITYYEEQGIHYEGDCTLSLIHRQSTPYLPEWQVDLGKTRVYIDQFGTLSW